MNQPDGLAPVAEAVSGLEQAIVGIVGILERGMAKCWCGCWTAAEEKPPEESRLIQLLEALIGRLDRQQQTLNRNRIETGIRTFTDARWRRSPGSRDDGATDGAPVGRHFRVASHGDVIAVV